MLSTFAIAESLHEAAKQGDLESVRNALAEGVAVDITNNRGQTALLIAAQAGHAEVARALIDAGAAVDTKWRGNTPLNTAIRHGWLDVTDTLLRSGANLNTHQNSRAQLLHDAINSYALSQNNVHKENLEIIFAKLADAGAPLEATDGEGFTALHQASMRGMARATEILIEKGADIEARTPLGESALILACQYVYKGHEHVKIAKMLIKAGADVNARDHHQETPLIEATSGGSVELMEILLNSGADIEAKDKRGEGALDAAILKDPKPLEFLIANGADLNARNYLGHSPLHSAADVGAHVIVERLLSAGVEVDARNKFGMTPLHRTAEGIDYWTEKPYANVVETANLLIKAGADINAVDQAGRTPLHFAAELGFADMVTALVEAGADGSIKNGDGKTPFEVAKQSLKSTPAYYLLRTARSR
jgi:ankyrin repeat protein